MVAEDRPDITVGVESELEIPGVVTISAPGPFESDTPADREHPYESIYEEPCAEWIWFEFDLLTFELIMWIPPKCEAELTCGAERIDDLFFGRLSGTGELTGVYGEFLNEVIDGTIEGAGGGVTDVDLGDTNESVLGQLGEPPSTEALAVFRWCRHEDGSFERLDPTWAVDFQWDTTIDDEYPIPQVIANLFDRVRSELGLYEPDVKAAPPVELGRTFVKFPTWLWVDDPLEHVYSSARSDLDLIEVEVRAQLGAVEFHLGDVDVECSTDQMLAYVPGEMHPIDDVPECHHQFLELVEFRFATSLHYDIEQRVRQRTYSTYPWPDAPWEPHATNPTVTLTTDVGDYSVRELLSLVVNQELDFAGD